VLAKENEDAQQDDSPAFAAGELGTWIQTWHDEVRPDPYTIVCWGNWPNHIWLEDHKYYLQVTMKGHTQSFEATREDLWELHRTLCYFLGEVPIAQS
jgi:hypothetical protein